jgi:hypothetical protein
MNKVTNHQINGRVRFEVHVDVSTPVALDVTQYYLVEK